MRGLGYETVAISSGFEEVIVRSVDRLIDTGQANEYELVFARESAIGSAISSSRRPSSPTGSEPE